MQVVRCVGFGATDVLHIQQESIPVLERNQVRVRVVAVGVNRADILQRKGLYAPPKNVSADILGLEYAGEIVEIGTSVQKWNVGDRVMGIVAGASYAEQLVVHEREVIKIPNALNFMEAAAIPEAFLTAFDALFLQLQVSMGERVLVHAIGSGVGNAALQLVKAIGGTVIGTSRTENKISLSRDYGMDVGIHVQDGTFLEHMPYRVHKVLDFVGAAYMDQNMRSLLREGEIIVVGLLGGRTADINLGLLLQNRLKIRGTVLRMRPLEEKIELVNRFTKNVLPLFEAGLLRPVVDRVYDMKDVAQAHQYMESNQNFGKIILQWS